MDIELEAPSPSKPKSQNTSAHAMTPTLTQPKSLLRCPRKSIQTVSTSKVPWRLLRVVARIGLYAGLCLYVGGTYFVKKFDDKLVIERPVRRNPVQTEIKRDPFPFEYRGHKYQVAPVAAYEISGLVVTHNDISSVLDAYHTSDSVDFRDICLVWGANVGSGIFRRFKFWSMPWSCHYQTQDHAAAASFVETQFSNNHLLAPDDRVRRTIRSMQIGDQISLKGMLVNYWPAGQPGSVRRSSTTREDTGNGACEVMWVEHAEILRPGGTNWHAFKNYGFWVLISAVVLNALLFVLIPLKDFRKLS